MPTQSNNVNNYFNVPGMYEDILANQPQPAIVNRIFLSTDTKEWYRDTGTAWELWFQAESSSGWALGGNTLTSDKIFGNISATKYNIQFYNGNAEAARISSNNNFLIGTTTDGSYLLKVAGSMQATTADFTSNIIQIGTLSNTLQVGKPTATGTLSNLIFGYSNMNGTVTGSDNLAIGRGVMQNITSGASNVAIGSLSGKTLSSAGNNTFVGVQAGQNHTTGNGNVYVGALTGLNGAGATNNVMIGLQAGSANTANYNVYIGHTAGSANNAQGNVFIGANAGSTITGATNKLIIASLATASGTTGIITGDFGTGVLTFQSTIQTADPGLGAGNWLLGVYTAGAPAATGYVQVKINGVAYKLLTST